MKIHTFQGITLLIALVLLFIHIPFINGLWIASIIILINALMELFD
jgi:hypothetical protein